MPTRQTTILVIDDNAAIRGVVRDVLQCHQYRVLLAADAAEAQLLCQQHQIDLVLLEGAMPGIIGWSLALAVKRWLPQAPLIIVSWMPPPTSADAALPASIASYLHKTVSPSLLVAEIARLLGERPRQERAPWYASRPSSWELLRDSSL